MAFLPPIAVSLLIGLGTTVASSVLQSAFTPPIKVGKLDDLSAPKSSYGATIPKVWGTARVGGNVIWASNLDERKKTGKGFGPKTTQFSYYGDAAYLLCEGPIYAIRKLWLNGDLVYDVSPGASTKSYNDSVKFQQQYFRFYAGTTTQSVDALLQTATGDPIAYRDRAYLVFENLPLEKYGNRYPSLSAEVVTSGTTVSGRIKSNPVPLSAVLSDICAGAGLAPTQYDTAAVAAIPVTGFYLNEANSDYRTFIHTLQKAYFFEAVESEGRIKFQPSKQNSVVTIPRRDLGADTYSANKNIKYFEETRIQDLELPKELVVSFQNPALNYAQDTRRATRKIQNNTNTEAVNLPIVLTASEGSTTAHKLLSLTWFSRNKFKFSLPPKYLALEAGDVVTCDFHGYPQQIKLTKIEIGANLLIKCEGVPHDNAIYDYAAKEYSKFSEDVLANGNNYQLKRRDILSILSVKNLAGTTIYTPITDWTADLTTGTVARVASGNIPANTRLKISYETEEIGGTEFVEHYGDSGLKVLASMPLLTDTDPDNSIYFAVNPGQNRFWGGLISASVDGGQSYGAIQRVTKNTVSGVTTTALPNFAAGHTALDSASTVRVQLDNGVLESKTASTPKEYWEKVRIGNEIVRFRTATLVGDKLYDLSNFWRGQRGTDPFIPGHAVGEEFTLLDDSIVSFVPRNGYPGDPLTIKYEATNSVFDDVEDSPTINYVNDGATLLPYAPTNVDVTGTVSAGLTVSWQRRDRRLGDAINYTNLPNSENSTNFEIDVLTSADIIKRTLISGSGSTIYTALQIAGDFGSTLPPPNGTPPPSGTIIKFRIYQISASVGRGRPKTFIYTVP